METEFLNYALEYGGMGGFCIFLLYLNKLQFKEHHSQLGDIRTRADAQIEQYRQERDDSLKEHGEERTQLRTNLGQNIKRVELAVVQVQTSLEQISLQLESGMSMIKEYQQEALVEKKAKEIARLKQSRGK